MRFVVMVVSGNLRATQYNVVANSEIAALSAAKEFDVLTYGDKVHGAGVIGTDFLSEAVMVNGLS